MFVEKIKTEGLAHLSYLVGDAKEAAVIDPRRDVGVYLELAAENGVRITSIFETHRNEDLISGAKALADETGAPVYHGPNPDGEVTYAETTMEGDEYAFGELSLKVLETPGHTYDSLSFAMYDKASGEKAVGVFTGDALFIGDVGRTDFYPDRAKEVAGLLYDSLQKILGLGDQAILYPAHGAGSVCGSGMADREFSTLGYERQYNPPLGIGDREDFIRQKVKEQHYVPPYFETMERLNLEGTSATPNKPATYPLDVESVARCREAGSVLLDVRPTEAFCSAHVPGSLALSVAMIPAFAGWLLKEGDRLVLVADGAEQAASAMRQLARIGFDNVLGYLPGMMEWITTGRSFDVLPPVDAATVKRRQDEGREGWTLLDVRGVDEVEEQQIGGSRHIYLGELPGRLNELDREQAYTVMCGSGVRATVAASVLRAQGWKSVDVFLGSMKAWKEKYG